VLLLDNSAWARLDSGDLDPARRERVAAWMAAGELAVCLPFLLEAGYSARSASDYETMMRYLSALPAITIDADIELLALAAQSSLARAGHHRTPPSDVVIAACAHRAGAGVLHYDHDFDVIVERTELEFASEWLAPRGSI
jgi:predicted nucleic acid-binding protein